MTPLEQLEQDEGFKPYCFDDATGEPIVPGYTLKGHATLWYGLCVEKGRIPNVGTLPQDCLEFVAGALWSGLVAAHPWVKDQPADVQSALFNMAYNLGLTGLLGFKLMLAALERGDRQTAAANVLNSQAAKQLPKRYQRLADQIRGYAE